MPVLFADALTTYYLIGAIAVPILIGVFTFLSSYREGASFGKRVGMELRGNSPLPVSRACPTCGSLNSKKSKSKDQFLISFDRECAECRSHYALPVPRWLSWSFIVLGVILFVGGVGLAIYARRQFPEDRLASVGVLVVGVGLGFQAILAGVGKLRVVQTKAG